MIMTTRPTQRAPTLGRRSRRRTTRRARRSVLPCPCSTQPARTPESYAPAELRRSEEIAEDTDEGEHEEVKVRNMRNATKNKKLFSTKTAMENVLVDYDISKEHQHHHAEKDLYPKKVDIFRETRMPLDLTIREISNEEKNDQKEHIVKDNSELVKWLNKT